MPTLALGAPPGFLGIHTLSLKHAGEIPSWSVGPYHQHHAHFFSFTFKPVLASQLTLTLCLLLTKTVLMLEL